MMAMQKEYNGKKISFPVSEKERDLITQNLALCAHSEISSLTAAVNFKHHHQTSVELDKAKVLYESVDVVRYMMAIMNLWDISAEDFTHAFKQKDNYLNITHDLEAKKWKGEKVIIVDIDDVLGEFRKCFASWLEQNYNIAVDVESTEYYFITALSKIDVNPEKVFENFIADRGFMMLPTVLDAIKFTHTLKSMGYWLHLLTARPAENYCIFYDTYSWLTTAGFAFDRLDFSSEKFRWCAQSEYYDSGAIEFAIDDSPKHALEYAKHGIRVKVPLKSYNKHIEGENIQFYNDFDDLLTKIRRNN